MKKVFIPALVSMSMFLGMQQAAVGQTVYTLNTSGATVTTTGTQPHVYPFNGTDWDVVHPKVLLKNTSGVSYPVSFKVFSESYPQNDTTKWGFYNFCMGTDCKPAFLKQGSTNSSINPGQTWEIYLGIAAPTNGANGTAVIKGLISTQYQSDTVTFVVTKTPIGINTIKLDDNRVSIYPNPATSANVTVFANQDLKAVKAKVFNMIGAEVAQADIKNELAVINVATLPTGLYLVHIANDKGQVVTTRKFVKN